MSAPCQNILLRALPADACLTLDELERLVDLPALGLRKAVSKLVSRRLIERVQRGCYRLTEEGIAAVEAGVTITSAPLSSPVQRKLHNDRLRQRLWAAMRMRSGSFTAVDIACLSVKDEVFGEKSAQHYLRALTVAGYLRRLPKRGGLPIRYVLIKDTGPIAPVVSRKNARLYDRNSGETVPCRS